jgi:cytochrome c oxidase cbb3-type subunit 3
LRDNIAINVGYYLRNVGEHNFMEGRRGSMSKNLSTKIRSRLWILTASAIPAVAALALISTAARAADLTSAASSYTDTCAKCHGPAGKGDGPKAAELKDKDGKLVASGDLSDCAKMSKITDDDMFKELKEGGVSVGKSKFMTPYGDAMEDDEIKAMVAYVRTLCKK